MSGYLDTDEYYRRRERQTKLIALQRAYFGGFPYSEDPREATAALATPLEIWTETLKPTDKEKPPAYIENGSRTKIEDILADIWPTGSGLVFEGIEDDLLDRVQNKLLNFAGGYASGLKGLNEWVDAALMDAAQGGDGLAMAQLLGDKVRMLYYGAEYWDLEMENGEPLHYRFEMKIKWSDGKTRIERVDIYKDHIERFRSGAITNGEQDDGVPPPDMRPVATDPLIQGTPPTDLVRISTDQDTAEGKIMVELDDWVCVPLRWRRLQHKDTRGTPEMMFNDLMATDDINRLLSSWKDAAHGMGNPPMIALDMEEPKDQRGERIAINKENMAPGEVIWTTSTDDGGGGKLMYPANPPHEAPYEKIVERLRMAFMGNTPLSGPSASGDVSRFAEMSAFAKDILEKVHRERVARIRERIFDNGIARVLKTGVVMLAMNNMVEGLSVDTAKKLKIKFEYGGPMLSADEKVKGATYVSMMQKVGIPPNELVPLMPFEPQDRDELIAELDRKAKQEEQFAEQMQELALKPPPTAKVPSVEKASGADKRGR